MTQKRSLMFIIVFFIFVLMGCQTNDDAVALSSGKASTVLEMPEKMPNDFNFSISFGVGKRNEINTFNGTVTKDLIVDGTKTIKLELNKEELQMIYEKMKEIKINETKELIPKKGCIVEPHEDDEWTIEFDDKTIKHNISGEYCEPTEDAKQLLKLRNYILNIIKSKDVYQSLPKPNGSYE